LDLDENEWFVPEELSKNEPKQRAGHSATLVDQKMFIFGGSCGHNYLEDICILDTGLLQIEIC
jgi:hypothetical protein